MGLDDFQPRPQPEVEGVAQTDLGLDVPQHLGRHGLDRAVGPHGHKHGGFHDAVGEGEAAAPGLSVGGEQFVVHGKSW